MAAHFKLVRRSLTFLWLFAYFALYVFGTRNGLLMQIWTDIKKSTLPDGTPVDGAFTHIWAVDLVIGGIVRFFWPILDGSSPYLSIANIPFAGQFVACFLMAAIEAARAGNQGRGILSATGLAMIIQMHGYATGRSGTTFKPTPATVLPRNTQSLKNNLAVVILSYILFTVFVSLPAASVEAMQSKFNAIALWLFFPACGMVLDMALSAFVWTEQRAYPKTRPEEVALLRRVYMFACVVATVAHLNTAIVSSTVYTVPGLFNDKLVETLTPGAIYIPTSPFRRDFTVNNIAHGVHVFMQWDYYISSTAFLAWALVVRHSVEVENETHELRGISPLGVLGWCALGLRVMFMGPIASAMSLVWERDEIVLAGDNDKRG